VIVDCDSCQARGPSCSDCVVTFLLGPPAWLVDDGLPAAEITALAVLADSGLVPPLRLVPGAGHEAGPQAPRGRAAG
jgi:hypothetical protein